MVFHSKYKKKHYNIIDTKINIKNIYSILTKASETSCLATTSGENKPPLPDINLVSGGLEASSISNPGVSVSGG